jgi:hypothetical protein
MSYLSSDPAITAGIWDESSYVMNLKIQQTKDE